MENQNSTPQEKKRFFALHGRKKKAIIVGMAVLLLFGIIGGRNVASKTRAAGYNLLMGTGNVALAAKDFEPLGIVFAEASGTSRDGYRATYDALMREAAEKDADAIINVNISSTRSFFTRTWSGSALAIKYLDTVPGETRMPADIASAALQMRGGKGFGRNRF